MDESTPTPPVRWAVVGTNWISAAFVAAGRTVPGFRLACVHSRDEVRGRKFADEFGGARIHTSIASLAGDPDVDAVYVATPNSLHSQHAIALLAAGKPVLGEKPFAANLGQAQAMVAAARGSGALLMEAYVTAFTPNFQVLAQAIGGIGPVRRVLLGWDLHSDGYERLIAGELPNEFNPALAAGSLLDIGVYAIAPAIHLFGRPRSVLATGLLVSSGVDGQGTVLLDYDGMQVVALHSKMASAPAWSHFEGEAATLSIDRVAVPTAIELRDRAGHCTKLAVEQSPHHMRYEIAHFQQLLALGALESPIQTHDRSLAVMEVMDEARAQMGLRYPGDPVA